LCSARAPLRGACARSGGVSAYIPQMNLAETADRYEWPARALFGVLLAASAIGAAVAGGYAFAGFIALVTGVAAREWHRMFGGSRYGFPIAATAGSIVLALACAIALRETLWPVLIL